MSANNIVFIKNNKQYWEVYYQGCSDAPDLGSLEKKFKTLKEACNYAEKMCEEYQVEYGIRFIFYRAGFIPNNKK